MQVRDLRNIRDVSLELGPGLNVFLGRNAQGKTSLLEAVALLARGRSFRTEQAREAIRRGAARLAAGAEASNEQQSTRLEVEIAPQARRFRVNGQTVAPQAYRGRLEVVVYSSDRLRVIRGPMRERRQFLDRGAAALWPAYRQTLREYERVVGQRNRALVRARADLAAWSERLVVVGAALRQRRAEYVRRLRRQLEAGEPLAGERYQICLEPDHGEAAKDVQREALAAELSARRREEDRAGRSLAGPHRDQVRLRVNGEEAETSSSGQGRSLLLALTLASLALYQEERGTAAIALLDDLDSELDEERVYSVCRALAERGQALVTTAHAAWAERVAPLGQRFEVRAGSVRPA